MAFLALVVSLIQLFVVCRLMRRGKGAPTLTVILCCVGFAVVPLCLMVQLTAVMFQSLLLGVAALLWPKLNRWCPSFLVLSLGLTLVVYGSAACLGWASVTALQHDNPYESMEARLPTPKPVWRPRPSGSARQIFLDQLDVFERGVRESSPGTLRSYHLEQLHEHTLRVFISSPGFGVTRMSVFTDGRLRRRVRDEGSVAQPDGRSPPDWSPGLPDEAPGVEQQGLGDLHLEGAVDFVNAAGFGFVKDRRHVAGFQAHEFSRVPTSTDSWTVARLELIGLVLHDRPVAYVSAGLPRMDELREAATRPLDGFEAFGLSALRDGERLFIRPVTNALRMVGAIWNGQQCVACHGGERGDLLGAFSYTLLRRPP